jgi:hypothetical protein
MMNDCCCTPLLGGAVAWTPEMNRVRRVAFDALRTGTAPGLRHIADRTGLDAQRVRHILGRLVAGGIATTESDIIGDPTVVGADGLTIRATRHQLILDALPLYTWCGFDTVGIPAALGVDAVACTVCPMCGSAIELLLRDGAPPSSPLVGWWPLATSGPVNESFCPTANLFCDRDHLDAWRASAATGPGEALPLTALAERGRQTWSMLVAGGRV